MKIDVCRTNVTAGMRRQDRQRQVVIKELLFSCCYEINMMNPKSTCHW